MVIVDNRASSRPGRLRAALPVALAGVLAGVVAVTAVDVVPAAAATAPVAVHQTPVRPAGAPVAAGQPLRIMPLGDSITAGVGSRRRSSYRIDLARRLAGAGIAADFVGSQRSGAGIDNDHEGHGGWTIDQISHRLDGWLATYQPDVVLVHLGTNNVTRGEAPEVIAAKLSALIDQIRAARPDALIVVSKIIGSKVRAELAVDHAYNALLTGVVSAKDPWVALVDQSTVNGIDLLDLRHPNDFGYAKMSYTYYRALERLLDVPGGAWPTGVNPHLLRSAQRCLWRPVYRNGERHSVTECRRWTLRTVRRRIDGVDIQVRRWQTQRRVTETYTETVRGKKVTRERQVIRWVGAELWLDF